MNLIIKPAELSQESGLLELYKEVSLISNGIIRIPKEISREYISGFMRDSIDRGLILVGILDNKIVGEIHAYTPNIYAFRHILTDLTIVVDPVYHGQGIGRKLLKKVLKYAGTYRGHALIHDTTSAKFYKALGIREGIHGTYGEDGVIKFDE